LEEKPEKSSSLIKREAALLIEEPSRGEDR
jgi:hypothetical protein